MRFKDLAIIVFVFCCAISLSLKAENESDSLHHHEEEDRTIQYSFSPDAILLDSLSLLIEDTLLSERMQRYDPLYRDYDFFSRFGNIGQAHQNLCFSPDYSSGFNYGITAFNGYRYHYDKIPYYKIHHIYTDLHYVSGALKEQIFRVSHSQNISPRINIGVNYQIVNSPSMYYRQYSDDSNLALSLRYQSENNRYGFIANYVYNRIKTQENGGITDADLYEPAFFNFDQTRLNSNYFMLSSAQSSWKDNSYYMYQYLLPGKDSICDSVVVESEAKWGKLSHSFRFHRTAIEYFDDNPQFGETKKIFYDSLATRDSTHLNLFENIFAWESTQAMNLPIFIKLGLKHQFVQIDNYKYAYDYIDSVNEMDSKNTASLIPFVDVSLSLNNWIKTGAYMDYVWGGYNTFDWKGKGYIALNFSDSLPIMNELRFNISSQKRESPWIYKSILSNHYYRDTDFKSEQISSVGTEYKYKSMELAVDYNMIDNFMYFNARSEADYYDKTLEVLSVKLNKRMKYKGWGSDNKFVYQKVVSGDVLHLPEFMVSHSQYITFTLFKKALVMQPGFDISWLSAFYGDAYQPALHVFYLQNQIETGNYIHADAFINFKVKRARIFVKYQHINYPVMPGLYYITPNYPVQGMAFKYGISWKFYD